jgi:tetratricopeptide (TPR) repeat protein
VALVSSAFGRDTSCTPAASVATEGRALYTPQRLFGEVGSSTDVLGHEPFLERARLQREQEQDASARLALGAYVVARLVDRLLTLEVEPSAIQGFHWQLEAVRRHLTELPSDAPETAHLVGVVEAISADGLATPSLWKSISAYAYFLEHEGRLEESLEMLALAARSQGQNTPAGDFAAYALFAGRLNRMLARWDPAIACYSAAEEAAALAGDSNSVLRGRLGQGAVHRGRGNLPMAREIAENAVRDATELQLPDAQVIAYADLGSVYALQGLRLEALGAQYKAFQLSRETPQRMRALGDLAIGLSEIGALDAARLAFQIVADSDASVLVRANALLELMDLESSVENRVAFERCRTGVQLYQERMSPSMQVDYHYKMGVGFARFGQVVRARTSLTTSLELAERHRLNAWYFKIEQALAGLANDSAPQPTCRQSTDLSEAPVIREMEMGLREYAVASAN